MMMITERTIWTVTRVTPYQPLPHRNFHWTSRLTGWNSRPKITGQAPLRGLRPG